MPQFISSTTTTASSASSAATWLVLCRSLPMTIRRLAFLISRPVRSISSSSCSISSLNRSRGRRAAALLTSRASAPVTGGDRACAARRAAS